MFILLSKRSVYVLSFSEIASIGFLCFIFKVVDPGMAALQNLQQQMGAESQLQSLPPAVQKAILLHLTQQQQQQESHLQGNEPQRAEGQDDSGTNRGKFPRCADLIKIK